MGLKPPTSNWSFDSGLRKPGWLMYVRLLLGPEKIEPDEVSDPHTLKGPNGKLDHENLPTVFFSHLEIFECSTTVSLFLDCLLSFVLAGIASSIFYLPAPLLGPMRFFQRCIQNLWPRHATTLHGRTGCIWQQWLATVTLKTFFNPSSFWVIQDGMDQAKWRIPRWRTVHWKASTCYKDPN